MITARPQKNLKNAKEYFRKHLMKGDYHSEGQRVEGSWFGKGAARLGLDLAAPVTEIAFVRLCDNQHPLTGDQLTVRARHVDRRVFYDFVISAPKSLSAVALAVGDPRLVAAHDAACQEAMRQMERVAAARVRKDGKRTERTTAELTAAVFRHDTSRALDPQLHTHFVVFNVTWDPVERRHKAIETGPMYNEIKYFTEVYRNELARRVADLGYAIRATENGFELEGVSPAIIDRFSKRRRAIKEAEAQLTAKLGRPLTNNERATLAHARRQRKLQDLDPAEVLAYQRAQLSADEFEQLRSLVGQASSPAPREQAITAADAIDYARDHLFERQSVVPRFELLREALRYSRGRFGVSGLEEELAARTEFIDVDDRLTTKESLRHEQRLVAYVNRGIGTCRALNPSFSGDRSLNEEQRLALQFLLRSPDYIMGFRGGAGTGKTRLLTELVRGIEKRYGTVVLAPTTASVEALRKEGCQRTATVQRFLADGAFQRDTTGKVLVVDEAGLLCTRDALALVEYAAAHQSRLILCGDTRQHSSVEAGDALRLLEKYSALRPVAVNRIQRQIDREYREAIAELARGRSLEALSRLERIGAVEVRSDAERYQRLAAEYIASVKAGKSALIVSPTWREIGQVTGEVRARLKAEGLLSEHESVVTVHQGLKWTRAQKRDLRNYRTGLVLEFHKSTQHFASGDTAEVVEVQSSALRVRKHDGTTLAVTKKQVGCFEVASKQELKIASGERLLLQGNRKTDGLFNGQVVTVKEVRSNGTVLLADGRRIRPEFRDFTYGYCVTSHAAQGRTVDHVYVAVDSHTLQAAHRKQFYVSASRGREKVKLFTDDLDFLRQAVTEPGIRLSATELTESARLAARESAGQRHGLKLGLRA